MQKTINVTARDIELGSPMAGRACPVARAINRLLKPGFLADVTTSIIRIRNARLLIVLHITTPEPVSRFIDRFDSCRKVKPISFELYIHPSVLKQKVIPKPTKKSTMRKVSTR